MNIQENKLSVNVPANTIKLKDIKPMNTQNTYTLLSQVIEQLKQLNDNTVIQAYNDYADSNGYESIFDNDSENINMLYSNANDALMSAHYGNYYFNHDYFVLNGYANLNSFSTLTDDNSPIDYEELAQWIIDNDSYDEYDIEVVTWLDMKDSIEDNIADDENLLNKLADYLTVELGSDYGDNVDLVMDEVDNYSYEGLQDIIILIGIKGV